MNLVEYKKRKNSDLFDSFKKRLGCTNIQNYIPVYNKFFTLNDTNYNSVNFNNRYYIQDLINKKTVKDEGEVPLHKCLLKDCLDDKVKMERNVFFKMAPLLDPFKFIIGKYTINDQSMYNLPKFNVNLDTSVYPKLKDENNASYVDGLFSFLSSKLIHSHNFIHGVDYYGSFLAIKKDFKFNIADDLEYLCQSDFFKQNKNKPDTFNVDDYDFLMDDENVGLKPIKISQGSNKSNLSIKSIDDEMYKDLFEDENKEGKQKESIITLNDLCGESLIDLTNTSFFSELQTTTTTIKSNSTCSSRTSHTSEDDKLIKYKNGENKDSDSVSETELESESGSGSFSGSDGSEIIINATIPKFPINIICMESCKDTFDSLIVEDKLSHDEWFSALMQIIMILITYQKCFSFTHNDLHTNNVMYIKTELKYIYYCFNKKYYRVPTFGRIYKLIDFGRSIYKYNNKLFCSDSFQSGADAATQYNTEPYFNEKKPRLEPNYSFDLCRIACSIFDYVIDDVDDLKDSKKCTPIAKLINEWVTDDNGLNILYKNNGLERYPEFKLYKMIARVVHNHIPEKQLDRSEFKAYLHDKKKILNNKDIEVVNIDYMISSIVDEIYTI
jgi:hypothetical protein